MHADELQPYDYRLPYALDNVFMVGWIDSSHAYNTGQVAEAVLGKLWTMIRTRSSTLDLHVNTIRGVHPCTISSEDVRTTDATGKPTFLGMSEIWVPHGSRWYAAPSLVVHFIEDHGYLPPVEFLNAISEFDLSRRVISQEKYDQAIREKA